MWTWAIGAWACDGADYAEKVVGWSADGTKVLLRSELTAPGPEEPPDPKTPFLTLTLVELATGRATKSWPILALGEKANAALRGTRWKAAETELAALKVAVDGAQKPLSEPWAFAGRTGLRAEYDGCVDGGMVYTLRSTDTELRLKQQMSCAAELSLTAFTAWAAPLGKGLFLVADTGCAGAHEHFWISTETLRAH